MTMRLGKVLRGVAASVMALSAQPGLGQESHDSLVQGFVRFMAYHEAGHLLMNQVQGINANTWPREDVERYADQIAMVLLAPDADDPDGVAEMVGAANAWMNAGAGGHAADDPHAPPQERAYNIICYMYGSNPGGFAGFKQYIEPDWDCENKFKTMNNELAEAFTNAGDEQGIPIELTYEAAGPGLQAAQAYLQDSGILEDLIYDIEQEFKLDRPTKMIAMTCKGKGDEGTFHFDTFQGPSKNYDQVSICYELVDMWMKTGNDIAQ